MKRTNKLLALMLIVASIFPLAACKSDSDITDTGGNLSETAASAAPEYVYASEFDTLVENSETGFAALAMTERGLYYAELEKVGDATPEGVTPEYEGQYDINEVRLYVRDFEGNAKKLDNFVPLKSAVEREGKRDYTTLSHPECMTLDEDGNIIIVEQIVTSWSDAPEEISAESAEYFDYAQSQTESYLRVLDETGAEISCAELDIGEDVYISSMCQDERGNIVLAYAGTGSGLAAYSIDGAKQYDIAVDGYLYHAAKLKGGAVGALIYDNNNGLVLRTADGASGTLSDEYCTLPIEVSELIPGAGEYDFYYTAGSSFYGYSLEREEADALFNWVECDVNGDNMSYIRVGEDGKVRGICAESGKGNSVTVSLVTLYEVPSTQTAQKEELTLATVSATIELKDAVIDFNRKSDKYRVNIRDYYELTGQAGYDEAVTKLTTELAAGNMPDILDLTELPYSQLAAKGILEDIYPYIDADKDLKREDFFENVLSSYEIGGKLYAAVAEFGITSVMGAQSVVGDKPGWTYADYYAALDTMPEGCQGFDWYCTKETMLRYSMMIDLGAYVDWASGECRFDGDSFKALLEFANSFPSNDEMASYETSEQDSPEHRISQGQQMLTIASVYSFNETSGDNPFKTAATYIGFPNATGSSGSTIHGLESYAMTSACKDKAAAWEFLRTFLTEEYQLEGFYFPTNKNAYAALRADATKIEYETDDAGHILLDENGERKRKVIGMMYDGTTTKEMYSGMSEERAQAIDALISSADSAAEQDSSITDIVIEGAQAYFAGQKTAVETAKLIQSKANIYVNEQR